MTIPFTIIYYHLPTIITIPFTIIYLYSFFELMAVRC